MYATRARIAMLAFLMAVGALAALIILSATARADTMDDRYVSVLHTQGISSSGGDSSLIAAGHLVCRERANGMSGLAIAYQIEGATNLGPYDAGYLVGAAEGAYCPWLGDAGASSGSTV